MRTPLAAVLVAAIFATSACTAMMHAMTPKPRIVDNPLLSGQPIELTKSGDVSGASEADCSIWPFEDKLTVSVSTAEICVEQHKHITASSGWVGEPTSNRSEGFRIANDAGEGGYINATKGHAAKVGSCFNRGYNAQTAIWAVDYKGCAPNNATVTAATKSLTVGDESWTFPAGAPVEAGSAAPGATASN